MSGPTDAASPYTTRSRFRNSHRGSTYAATAPSDEGRRPPQLVRTGSARRPSPVRSANGNRGAPAMARVDALVDGIYRICTTVQLPDNTDFQFNQFLIDDERPALIHTGMYGLYEGVRDGVAEVLDPSKLEYVMPQRPEPDLRAGARTRGRSARAAALGPQRDPGAGARPVRAVQPAGRGHRAEA